MLASPRPVWRAPEPSVHPDPNRKAWADGQRWLEVEIALDDLLTSLVQTFAAALPERLQDRVVIAGPSELGAHAQYG